MTPREPEAMNLVPTPISAPPNVCWSDIGDTEHFVQFYERDTALLEVVHGYVKKGLTEGATAIVIATRDHLDALEQQWRAASVDLAGARHRGQYIAFDAAEMLSRLMLDDWPQAKRFSDIIGSLIARACGQSPRVIAFGEMVALLWKDGKQSAAIRSGEVCRCARRSCARVRGGWGTVFWGSGSARGSDSVALQPDLRNST